MHGVTGPNEYENNVNNNWFTSTGKMALEIYARAFAACNFRSSERVHVTEEERKSGKTLLIKLSSRR